MKCRKVLFFSASVFLPLLQAGAGIVRAVPLPNPQVAGFNFPESEATVLGWVYQMGNDAPADAATAFENLHLHAWGLWTAVTLPTSQVDNGQPLRVFETWFTPQELENGPNLASAAQPASALPCGAAR